MVGRNYIELNLDDEYISNFSLSLENMKNIEIISDTPEFSSFSLIFNFIADNYLCVGYSNDLVMEFKVSFEIDTQNSSYSVNIKSSSHHLFLFISNLNLNKTDLLSIYLDNNNVIPLIGKSIVVTNPEFIQLTHYKQIKYIYDKLDKNLNLNGKLLDFFNLNGLHTAYSIPKQYKKTFNYDQFEIYSKINFKLFNVCVKISGVGAIDIMQDKILFVYDAFNRTEEYGYSNEIEFYVCLKAGLEKIKKLFEEKHGFQVDTYFDAFKLMDMVSI